MTIGELVGTFTILGRNQDDSEQEYKGTLQLSLDENNRILAKWVINNEQEQFGTGFFKDNILVVNFYYLNDESTKYKGVVIYRCITPDILDGFWSEKHGDPLYLGQERCFRIQRKNQVLD
ncbi:conserved hypothetical protein [Formosa agariphila KMM 3901]|uniref:Uncharacterized protein n=1 Tax=Formosa agariphila (strain DSM 15362 / KCTC 12365 / LMG 23005 / KMM 3901 / M-2Alg 35-1) TaxID=1347342 RepID=T2KPM4_FORAG|nr:hypothetical protein [Formosa agariphila]CDF80401.1 conserved hypothetical protein [Formosa agariphila KMM 3901]